MIIPQEIQALLDEIIEQFKNTLGDNLIGIYLHGSLAMGCFNPKNSDIDFLVVVKNSLTLEVKKAIIEFTLKLSDKAPSKGLEYSIVTENQIKNFQYPTPFELHYSKDWKDKYKSGAVDYEKQSFDPDLAAHFVITKKRGLTLYGKPIDDIFPDIPEEYYLKSVLADAEAIYEEITENPIYGVLNLCRVLAYKKDGLVTSKKEGGEWALSNVDYRFKDLIARALENYANSETLHKFNNDELKEFSTYMKGQLD